SVLSPYKPVTGTGCWNIWLPLNFLRPEVSPCPRQHACSLFLHIKRYIISPIYFMHLFTNTTMHLSGLARKLRWFPTPGRFYYDNLAHWINILNLPSTTAENDQLIFQEGAVYRQYTQLLAANHDTEVLRGFECRIDVSSAGDPLACDANDELSIRQLLDIISLTHAFEHSCEKLGRHPLPRPLSAQDLVQSACFLPATVRDHGQYLLNQRGQVPISNIRWLYPSLKH